MTRPRIDDVRIHELMRTLIITMSDNPEYLQRIKPARTRWPMHFSGDSGGHRNQRGGSLRPSVTSKTDLCMVNWTL